MNLLPERWHVESLICGLRGHVVPARTVACLRPVDVHLGVEGPQPHHRFSRCLRCDAWLPGVDPETPTGEDLGDLAAIALPRRGAELRQAIVMRLIAIERMFHSIAFFVAFLALIVIDSQLGSLHDFAQRTLSELSTTGRPSVGTAAHWLDKLIGLDDGELRPLIFGALGYSIVEGLESWGLWREKPWAEYLTVLATVVFVPLEVYEVVHRVSPLKIVALAFNVGIVVWLIWSKRLFGVRGGRVQQIRLSAADLRSDPPRAVRQPA